MYSDITDAVYILTAITERQLPAILRTAPAAYRSTFADMIVDWRPDLAVALEEAMVIVGIEGPTDSIAYA